MIMTACAGLAVVAGLIFANGWHAIFVLMLRVGWVGGWLIPLRLLAIGLDAGGWRALLSDVDAAPWSRLFGLALIRDGVNALLPVVRVGGELVAIRLLATEGVSTAKAAASVIVETSITLMLQVCFTVVAIWLLLPDLGAAALVPTYAAALVGACVIVGLFVVVQLRVGLAAGLDRIVGRITGCGISERLGLATLDGNIRRLYGRRAALLRCAVWQLSGFAIGAGETGFVLYLLHSRPSIQEVFIIESLIQAVQSLSFVVPGALGIQEGGLVVLGAALGLNADTALALALIRRLRQVVTGLPALLVWQWRAHRQSGQWWAPQPVAAGSKGQA
ncbi:MAG: lysylphosphatidylglycerol synthase domain-containing protein [Acidiferrobacter sp.]